MDRLKALDAFQKAVLAVMTVLVFVFAVFYAKTVSRVGFSYKGAILVPSREDSAVVYSGKIDGQRARFTVAQDRSVRFQWGDKTYGPYTVQKNGTGGTYGLEIYDGESLMFRGKYEADGDGFWLYNEDGTVHSIADASFSVDGQEWDADGNLYDPVKPTVFTILSLYNGPKLTHKGNWLAWFLGVFLCVLNAFSILFADELFRLGLSFRINNASNAEPSEWELMTRKIGAAGLAVCALLVFLMGLK